MKTVKKAKVKAKAIPKNSKKKLEITDKVSSNIKEKLYIYELVTLIHDKHENNINYINVLNNYKIGEFSYEIICLFEKNLNKTKFILYIYLDNYMLWFDTKCLPFIVESKKYLNQYNIFSLLSFSLMRIKKFYEHKLYYDKKCDKVCI